VALVRGRKIGVAREQPLCGHSLLLVWSLKFRLHVQVITGTQGFPRSIWKFQGEARLVANRCRKCH
jgi:hypothetical protein